VGVLPLFVIRSALVGRTVTTLPGGLCADSPEVAAALLARGTEIARSVRAKRFVLHDTRREWPGEFQTVCEHESRRIDLRGGEEAVWKALDRNIRRQVRIAERNELRAVVDRTGERLDDFYSVLSRFTHRAGTPVFGRAFLRHVIEAFPDGFNIVVTYRGDEPIGGYFQLELGDTVFGAWGATLHEYLELRPVYLAYWQILLDATQRGFAYLDMGRSPRDTSAAQYKAQWGGGATPVYQQSLVFGREATGEAQSIAVQARSDGRMQTFRRFWPNLPFPVAQALGPYLRRHVPFA
jgi:CelD/BcsL family acetyltransferase involved in cellulose biosynthesis